MATVKSTRAVFPAPRIARTTSCSVVRKMARPTSTSTAPRVSASTANVRIRAQIPANPGKCAAKTTRSCSAPKTLRGQQAKIATPQDASMGNARLLSAHLVSPAARVTSSWSVMRPEQTALSDKFARAKNNASTLSASRYCAQPAAGATAIAS